MESEGFAIYDAMMQLKNEVIAFLFIYYITLLCSFCLFMSSYCFANELSCFQLVCVCHFAIGHIFTLLQHVAVPLFLLSLSVRSMILMLLVILTPISISVLSLCYRHGWMTRQLSPNSP